jgi:hypothetical protein
MIKEQVMRARRFKAFGDPSDVKNVAGAMKQTTLPRLGAEDQE